VIKSCEYLAAKYPALFAGDNLGDGITAYVKFADACQGEATMLKNLQSMYICHCCLALSAMSWRPRSPQGADVKPFLPVLANKLLTAGFDFGLEHMKDKEKAAKRLPLVELQEFSGLSDGDFYALLMNEILDSCEHCAMHPGVKLTLAVAQYQDKIHRMSVKELAEECQKFKLAMPNPAFVVNHRSIAAQALIQHLKDTNKAASFSLLVEMGDFAAFSLILDGMKVKLAPKVLEPPAASSATKSALGSVDEDGDATIALSDLWERTVSAEMVADNVTAMNANGAWQNISNIDVIKRCVIAEVQAHIWNRALGGPIKHGEHLSNVSIVYTPSEGKADKVQNLYLDSKTDTTLRYWGRVVDRTIAANLPRGQVLKLGSCLGLELYLDGGPASIMGRTSYCPAWAVKAVKQPKETNKDKEEQVQKKRRTSRGGNKASKAAALDVATHTLTTEEFSFKLTFRDQEMKFSYQIPMLTCIPEILEKYTIEELKELPLKKPIDPFDQDDLKKSGPNSSAASAGSKSLPFAAK